MQGSSSRTMMGPGLVDESLTLVGSSVLLQCGLLVIVPGPLLKDKVSPREGHLGLNFHHPVIISRNTVCVPYKGHMLYNYICMLLLFSRLFFYKSFYRSSSSHFSNTSIEREPKTGISFKK